VAFQVSLPEAGAGFSASAPSAAREAAAFFLVEPIGLPRVLGASFAYESLSLSLFGVDGEDMSVVL
jgi:hypothetical protein